MSDPNESTTGNETTGPEAAQPTGQSPSPKPKPPPSHEPAGKADETDWQAEARKWEARAKENREKALRLDQIEEANKTQEQRLTDALNTAQAEAEKARADALRYRIAAKHNITDSDAELFLTGTDADTLERQAARLAEQVTQSRPPRGYVPGEGQTPKAVPLNSDGLEGAIKSKLGIT